MIIWNPWHGCHKISEGCDHCYMYFLDRQRGHDTSHIYRTGNFDLPLKKNREGRYKLTAGMEVHLCLSSDFFLEEADQWRPEVWQIIKARPDLKFRILTKRAQRMAGQLPPDWGAGYDNVMLSVTCENQRRADERLPLLLQTPARHKGFMAAPFIGPIDCRQYLASRQIEQVLCGGENYDGARPCHCEWVQDLSQQCQEAEVTFLFIETGTIFVKDGKTYHLPQKQLQSLQAYKSGLSYHGPEINWQLHNRQGELFQNEANEPPHYRPHCATCGSKAVCSGCTECGSCGK